MSGIFVCYSRVDQPITEQLAALLRKAYAHVWYDDNLHGGEEWWSEILKEIASCQHFILLLSDASVDSEWCQKELAEAVRLGKHILPVLVRARTQIPDELRKIQHIDMSSGVAVESLNQLYATLVRHDRENMVPRIRHKPTDADRRQIDRLWMFVNGGYIEKLHEQVQRGSIDWNQYQAHIRKYLDLRSKGRESFSDPLVGEAFEAFDDALIQLDGSIGWTYVLKENNENSYMTQPRSAGEDSFWFEKYRRLVRHATDVWMRHAALVDTITTHLPDFNVMKEF